MDISQILFNRQGSIGGRAYWTGCAVLLAVGMALHILAFGFIYAINPEMIVVVGDAFEKIGLGLVGVVIPSLLLISLLFYPYLCLYTKRLRDIGISAYWYIAVFLAYCLGIFALGRVVTELLPVLPTDVFVSEMNVSSAMSDNEKIAAIIAHTRVLLFSCAVLHTTLHAVMAITIDVVLGKMKPERGQKTIKTGGAALA